MKFTSGYPEFTLLSEVDWSSINTVWWSGVHIVHWGGLEFTLLSYTLKLFSYVRGVNFLILKRIGEFSCSEFLYGLEFTLL